MKKLLNSRLSFDYDVLYETKELRGIEKDRPWQLQDVILNYSTGTKILVDVGCGTGIKLPELANFFPMIIGVEPNQKMIRKAKSNLKAINNIYFVSGYTQQLPFETNSIDIATSMMAPHDIPEIHRILKDGGLLIIETYGERDKHEFKLLFGKDEFGWRGQLTNENQGFAIESHREICEKLFSKILVIREGFWPTYYSHAGIVALLTQTPSIRDFSLEKDGKAIEQAVEKFSTPKGIELTQHRLLLVAQK